MLESRASLIAIYHSHPYENALYKARRQLRPFSASRPRVGISFSASRLKYVEFLKTCRAILKNSSFFRNPSLLSLSLSPSFARLSAPEHLPLFIPNRIDIKKFLISSTYRRIFRFLSPATAGAAARIRIDGNQRSIRNYPKSRGARQRNEDRNSRLNAP